MPNFMLVSGIAQSGQNLALSRLANSLAACTEKIQDVDKGSGPSSIWRKQLYHTGKCIRRFAGIYAYCRYFIDRKW